MSTSDRSIYEYSLDTETTGFNPHKGDKIVEIGIVELLNREPTGRVFHVYVDPQRDVPEGAKSVHGLDRDDLVELSGGKVFADIAVELVSFIGKGTIVAHNSGFDMSFLDAELAAINMPTFESLGNPVIDSLLLATSKYPEQRNSLDALCKRLLGANNYERDLHGALLDATLLARVYKIMTIEQQGLDIGAKTKSISSTLNPERLSLAPGSLRLADVSSADIAAHRKVFGKSITESGHKDYISSFDF